MLVASTLEGYPLHQAVRAQNKPLVLSLLRNASLNDFEIIIIYYNLEGLAARGHKNAVDAPTKKVALDIYQLVVHFKLFHAISEVEVERVERALQTHRKTLSVDENFPFINGSSHSLLWIACTSWSALSQTLQHMARGESEELLDQQKSVADRLKIWTLLNQFHLQKKLSGANLPH